MEDCHVCQEEIFFDEKDKVWVVRIENSNWNDYLDGFDYTDLAINFCYECGKDYGNSPNR